MLTLAGLKRAIGRKQGVVRMPLPIVAALVVICVVTSPQIHAQSAPAARQSFAVASIKPRVGTDGSVALSVAGNRLRAVNDSALMLIGDAYNLQSEQVVGATDWMSEDRYDIDARTEDDGALTQDQARQMLQSLLAERFQAKFHRDAKEMPVYALVIGKNGSKLKPSVAEMPNMTMGTGGGAYTGALHMTASKESMAQLARHFSHQNGVERFVMDKTGL